MRLSLKRRRPEAPAERRHPAPPTGLPDYEPVESADPLAEIAELMSANRRSADPATERRIVQLRHEAFAQLDRAPTEFANGGPADATLPQPDGLPEVQASELDGEALRAGILGGGSLLIRGLIDRERAERMRAGIDRTFESRDALMQGADRSDTTPWFDPFAPSPDYPPDAAQWNRMKIGGHAVWASDSPRMMFELLDSFDQSGLTGLITDYFGERPALSMNKSVLRRVSPDSGTDWHQDGAFLGRGIRTVNVWVALSRCGDVAPGLDIVSKRYEEIVETGTEGATFPWAVSPQVVDETRDDAPIARPTFEAGDALLFDHYCLHRTAVGPEMTENRYATETWCFAPSVYPDKTVPLVL
jgi:hypothetical protein